MSEDMLASLAAYFMYLGKVGSLPSAAATEVYFWMLNLLCPAICPDDPDAFSVLLRYGSPA